MAEGAQESGGSGAQGQREPEEDPLAPQGNPLRLVPGIPMIAGGSLVALVVMSLARQYRWGVPIAAVGIAVATWGILDLVGSFDDPADRVARRVEIGDLFPGLGLLLGGLLATAVLITVAVSGWLPIWASAITIPASFLAATAGVWAIGARLGAWALAPEPAPAEAESEEPAAAVDAAPDLVEAAHELPTDLKNLAKRLPEIVDETFDPARVADALLRAPAATADAAPRSVAAPVSKPSKPKEPPAPVPAAPAEEPVPIWRHHGFLLIALVTLLYLPMLGSHSLSDPWETHYGEVAREILARNDWISLWWAQDGWFWSKPVLDFWIQALAMAAFGVNHAPGQMLASAAAGRDPWPEWAVRLPVFLMTLVAAYLCYRAVAKIFGKRAGLLGGVALATMPQWFFVSHQTMTDMPFVAAMSACMALFLMGVHAHPEQTARVWEIGIGKRRLRVSLYHLVMGMIVATVLPQVLYLASRNLEISTAPFRIRAHLDAFSSGSPGNCGLPGNEGCRPFSPLLRNLHPALQALIWIQALAMLLYANWGERRVSRLCFLAAWYFAALSTMAKGPAGVGLPVLCALAYVLVTRRWKDLLRMEITSGLLILLAVALPWFVAMYARHGQPFTDRLLFHDMFKRAFTHVHDTNEGDDVSFRYYLWQLGYATFPWTGIVPAGLVAWLRRRDPGDPRTDGAIFFATWFVFAFALFSLMLTKFHHYILPAVPAAAMLAGIAIDDAIRAFEERDRHASAMYGAALIAGAAIVLLVGRDLAADRDGFQAEVRLLHLFTYNYKRPWPTSLEYSRVLWAFAGAGALATLLLAIAPLRRVAAWTLGVVGIAFAAWGIDVYFVRTSPHWGQRETILAYYRATREVPGPLVAYQMNWKGENFYAGNRLPAFVSSGKKFQDWILEEKKKGTKTFYFVTEHGRTGSLSNELGTPRTFEKLTPPELNNKFTVVRARFD